MQLIEIISASYEANGSVLLEISADFGSGPETVPFALSETDNNGLAPDVRAALSAWVEAGNTIATYLAPPAPPRDIAAEVAAHAIVLKIGAVNSMRPSEPPYPATEEVMATIVPEYQSRATEIASDLGLAAAGEGDPVPPEEVQVLKNIKAGFLFWKQVDAAAATILAAGDAADPIETDARWPVLPA